MAYFHENLKYHEDTKEKRNITRDDIEFLKALQKERNTQDHCGTADVRTWIIKDRKDYLSTFDWGYDYTTLFESENVCDCTVDDIYEYFTNIDDYVTRDKYFPDIKTLEYIKGKYIKVSIEENIYIAKTDKNDLGILIDDELVDFLREYVCESIELLYWKEGWKHEHCFLTQKAAENYLRKYGYNHSEDAHTYCICTYRDPEIARLMEIIETVDWEKVEF